MTFDEIKGPSRWEEHEHEEELTRMKIKIIEIHPKHPLSGLAFGEGVNEAGLTIRFAGDARLLRDAAEALVNGGVAEAEIESWQVIG